jgi:hypothetical protein
MKTSLGMEVRKLKKQEKPFYGNKALTRFFSLSLSLSLSLTHTHTQAHECYRMTKGNLVGIGLLRSSY